MNTVLHYFNQLDADAKVAITHGVRIVLILIAAIVLQSVASRLIRTFRTFMERRDPGQQSRIQTLGRVFRYIAAVVIWLLTGMLVLGELGISVAPVLATAGVAGQSYSDSSAGDMAMALLYGVQVGGIALVTNNLILELGYRIRATDLETEYTSTTTTSTIDKMNETYLSLILSF